MLKILIFSNVAGYTWAGSEELWLASALLALRSGCSVTALIHRDLAGCTELNEFRELGGKIEYWKPGRFARWDLIKQKFIPTFDKNKFSHYDTILVSAGSLPSLAYRPGLIEALISSSAKIITLCQFNADHLSISPNERDLVRALLSQCKSTIFVSNHNLEAARRQFSILLEQGRVIYNPIRTVFDRPLPWPEGDSIMMACVARMETTWKGQDILVDLLSRAAWRSRDYRLDFYGSGPDKTHIGRLISLYDLDSNVGLKGYERDLASIWKDHHIMVLPSHGEGTPLAVLEAMMAGRPVITTHVGGNTEIIEEGLPGFLAESASPLSFSMALERAWAARDNWKTMGEAAHAAARKLSETRPSKMLFKEIVRICNN